MKQLFFFLPSILLMLAFSEAHAQETSPHYHLINKISLGGEGGWDFIAFEESSRRLFISHATHVIVYDVDNEKIVGNIANTEGVHGIAFAREFNRGFISNGKSNTVLMFDLLTLDTLKRIPVGENPDAIIFDPFSKKIIVCNAKSKNASVIDAASGAVVKTIDLGSGPEFAVSNEAGHIYINLEDENKVLDIDITTFTVVHHWSLSPGEGPTGIAMDKKTNRLFIGCANKLMMILDAKSGRVIDKLPIGKGVDAVVFDPEKQLAISSNGEGNLTVVHEISPNKFAVTDTIKTKTGARTEALDFSTHTLYLPTADFLPASAPTNEQPHPRPQAVPNTFRVLKFGY